MFINWKRKKKKKREGRDTREVIEGSGRERRKKGVPEREKESVGENLPNLEKPLNRS